MTRNGGSRAWRKLAARAIRQAQSCYLCGLPLDKSLRHPDPMSAQADHIRSYANYPELRMDPSNVAVCHRACNLAKGNKELDELIPPPTIDW